MRTAPQRFTLSLLAVPLLTVVLIVLAVLQYQWAGELSRDERDRMQKNIETSANHFREGFYRELAAVCAAFQPRPFGRLGTVGESLARRWEEWAETGTRPALVTGVFVCAVGASGDCRLFRVDRSTLRLEPSAWPANFDILRPYLTSRGCDSDAAASPGRPCFGWRFAEQVPALLHPIFELVPTASVPPPPLPPRLIGFCLIELDSAVIRQNILPELAHRYFGGAGGISCEAAVISSGEPGRSVCETDPRHPLRNLAAADAVLPLMGGGPEDAFRLSVESRVEARDGEKLPAQSSTNPGHAPRLDRWGHLFPIIMPLGNRSLWVLVVQNRSGPLAAAVARIRRRNLAIGFGVLGLLAASMALIIVWAQRAQRLAELQMAFVAGVSHELRTPLAVIRSAADNLADGVVVGRHQVQEYGALIRGHVRGLSEIVEQVLLFAARKAGRIRYELRPVRMDEAVEAALRDAAPAITASGFTVEKTLPPGLPDVLADSHALKQCLQNLISNALKYGGDRRWMGIRVEAGVVPGGTEVRVAVLDKGPGISSKEQQRIFEAFYRGASARAGHVRGTGLGLGLAKEIAEAMGGKLTVQSELGKGSAFTLHFRGATRGALAIRNNFQEVAEHEPYSAETVEVGEARTEPDAQATRPEGAA